MFNIPNDILKKIQGVITTQMEPALASGTPKAGIYMIVCGTCQDTCKGTCRNRCNAAGKGIRR